MKKVLGAIVGVLLLSAGLFGAATWPWPKMAYDSLTGPPPVMSPNMVETRSPVEKVAGEHRPLPVGSRPEVDFSAAVAVNEKYQGFSLLIWQGGELIFEKYFNGGSPDARAESASMHKSVMATLMGVAVDDKLIGGVDDPVGNYIPEWKTDPRGKITIRNTLQMATGLEPPDTKGGLLSVDSRFRLGLFMRQATLDRKLINEPGAVFDYRNPNSQLAGAIIEAATKRRYADYLSEKIWKPLGAKDAYVWLDKPGGMPRTSGSLFARTEDWLRMGIMLKDGGEFEGRRIVSAAWVEQMTAPSPANPNYGFQVWRANPYVEKRWYDAAKKGLAVPAAQAWADPDIFFFDGFGGQRVRQPRGEPVIARQGPARLDWDDSELPNAVIAALRAAKPADLPK